MKSVLLLSLFLLAISCREKKTKPATQATVDQPSANRSIVREKSADVPTHEFQSLVVALDSLGFKSDTSKVKRLKNYRELVDGKIQCFGMFPFYKIAKEKSEILWWNTRVRNAGDSIDTEIFRTAESAWLYFYQKRETASWVSDGVIEQWKFKDEATTQFALTKLNSKYPFPYYNTNPYYIANGSCLYIFHTRAMAFSYGQKDIFQLFRKIVSLSNK
ncbi:MAG: hypothetical protein ACK5RG_19575 [Cyclobacteriaceae bacterium]|jgi:hypothetical protein|nr:hypothetical protein [Flammeovirgaceae bacterium]